MTIDRRKYLYRIKRLEIKSWLKYLMIEGKHVVDYVLGELMSGTDITIDNTVEKKFYKFDIKGNSTQDGIPAPDNEVPIYSAGDNGTISEKIVNKNLFDGTYNKTYTQGSSPYKYSSDNNIRSAVVKVKPNATYTISKELSNRFRISQYAEEPVVNTSYAISYIQAGDSNTEYTLTTSNTTEYLVIQVTSENQENVKMMVEQGSTATTYTAHQEQTYTIPVQQPMRSIGTVRDEFIENKERHNLGRVLFNGSESYVADGQNKLFGVNFSNYTSGSMLSNYYQFVSTLSEARTGTNLFAYYSGKLYFNNQGKTLEEFKTWLGTHNVEVIYPLTTPTDLPCTEEQISILENLPKSYNEQTNIYSLDVTPAYVEVQAYVKKEEVIEND